MILEPQLPFLKLFLVLVYLKPYNEIFYTDCTVLLNNTTSTGSMSRFDIPADHFQHGMCLLNYARESYISTSK